MCQPQLEKTSGEFASSHLESPGFMQSWILKLHPSLLQVYFKKIFHGCPLKINCSTTWENPATKGRIVCRKNGLRFPFQLSDSLCVPSLPDLRPAYSRRRRGRNLHPEPQQL